MVKVKWGETRLRKSSLGRQENWKQKRHRPVLEVCEGQMQGAGPRWSLIRVPTDVRAQIWASVSRWEGGRVGVEWSGYPYKGKG